MDLASQLETALRNGNVEEAVRWLKQVAQQKIEIEFDFEDIPPETLNAKEIKDRLV